MLFRFTFSAYVLSVIDERRICVRVDKEYLELVSNRLTSVYDKTVFRDTIFINVSDCEFDIDLDWKELTDLIGVQIKVNVALRRYSYYKTKTTYDDNNDIRQTLVQCKGVSFLAKKITNNV